MHQNHCNGFSGYQRRGLAPAGLQRRQEGFAGLLTAIGYTSRKRVLSKSCMDRNMKCGPQHEDLNYLTIAVQNQPSKTFSPYHSHELLIKYIT